MARRRAACRATRCSTTSRAASRTSSAASGADLSVRGGGCVAADFDDDGHTDLYVTTDSNAALLWNEGDGTFTEGASDAGAAAPGWLTGAAAGDVER